ncbi:adenine-specific DNA-methyltransferase [Biostraticola tofi]|uniref:Site-specific DNA-methyltransferase (adenine-specific) n=1 Tax=Biostraticola tofi TaxID=466109 RepID=A0A4R3YQZ6_9GAMM|nr:adenine-specific DNA-methyltransferase [Biostraticola tofi]TCV93654.1 DNA adenine methylase Dam [Biostraticola tofi]
MKKNRAFLKWAGGKYPLIEDIRRHLPAGDCLIEPFVGAGSVFLNTDYDRYILADINRDLINLYGIVKERHLEFIRDARLLFDDEANQAHVFYLYRTEFNLCTDDYRRALLFLYLNRHCYNGLCRYNLRGEFNVPFGRYKKPYFPETELYRFADKAQRAIFVCEPYSKTLSNAPSGSVVYCDPPYVPLSATANFTAYHTNSFSQVEQQDLAVQAYQLASGAAQVPVLISNHDTPETRQWYRQAQLHEVKVRRTISRNTLGRSSVNELLALFHYPGKTDS